MQKEVETLIELALAEDIGDGDVTAEYFVPENKQCRAYMLVKDEGVVAGLDVAKAVFEHVDASLRVTKLVEDGSGVHVGTKVMEIVGSARLILTAERTALNFVQRLSGVATQTACFVRAVEGTGVQVLDTRKTTPGWRWLEKMAVRAGGGVNHRMGLYDRAMVKDTNLVAEDTLDSLQHAIDQLKKDKPEVEVELEADRLDQVESFLKLRGVDYILLDNMTPEELCQAVQLRSSSSVQLEASGGVHLQTIAALAKTGVDYISVGALTHSAVALDISLEFVEVD